MADKSSSVEKQKPLELPLVADCSKRNKPSSILDEKKNKIYFQLSFDKIN